MANIGVKIRVYPNKKQTILAFKTVGSARFVYNEGLDTKEAAYRKDKTSLSYTALANRLPGLKKVYPWLKEVDSAALQQSLKHLDTAYNNFFNKKLKAKHPKHKSRNKSRWSYTTVPTNGNIAIDQENGLVKLPKLGLIKAVFSKEIPEDWIIKSATFSFERDMTAYVSICFEYDEEEISYSVDKENAIGLDYKSDGLFADSNGNVCGSPKYFRRAQKALTKAQRGLRHKKKGSKNYEKQKRKIAKVYRHIANQRKDFNHKKSAEIANLYDIVCIEDLDMKAMANKGFGNGKATMDNAWGSFVTMLKYKLERQGKILIKVDKWYPSSQICSTCGTQNREVKDLKIRIWTCPACNTKHNRDLNAAINIKKEGLRIYEDSIQ